MDWTVGGVAVSAAVLTTIGVAKFAKWHVNCWFCNGNQWVKVRDRAHFSCQFCGQYNGFKKDGGYDRVIREQHRIVPTKTVRYAAPRSLSDDSPFCTKCEDTMEIKRKLMADWEPENEDNWEAEYDHYKRRMEMTYPLCERCEMNCQRRLMANKQRYGRLEKLKHQFLHGGAASILSGLTSVSRMAARKIRPNSRRRFFSGGSLTTKLHLGGMITAGIMMIILIDTLLSDCGMDSLPLPSFLRSSLSFIIPHLFTISAVVATSHLLSFGTNKNRISLPDLISIPSLIWLSFCLSSPLEGENALQSVAASSSLFLLLTAVAILPRKRKHRKRPNHIINSAFSVASTPMSQVSSQADSFLLPTPSLLDENTSPTPMRKGDGAENVQKTPLFTHNRFSVFRENNALNTPMDMEWEESEACSPISSPLPPKQSDFSSPRFTRSSLLSQPISHRSPLSTRNGDGGRGGERRVQRMPWREMRREETPDRSTPARETSGPFPSSTTHFGVQAMMNGEDQIDEAARSIFGGGISRIPSMVSHQSRTPTIRSLALNSHVSEARGSFIPHMARLSHSPAAAPSIAYSHLTSASQMQPNSDRFYYLILLLTFTSVCTFIGMIILFYHTFFR